MSFIDNNGLTFQTGRESRRSWQKICLSSFSSIVMCLQITQSKNIKRCERDVEQCVLNSLLCASDGKIACLVFLFSLFFHVKVDLCCVLGRLVCSSVWHLIASAGSSGRQQCRAVCSYWEKVHQDRGALRREQTTRYLPAFLSLHPAPAAYLSFIRSPPPPPPLLHFSALSFYSSPPLQLYNLPPHLPLLVKACLSACHTICY